MQSRNRVGLPQPQRPQVGGIRFLLRGIHLIGRHDHGFARAAQHPHQGFIGIRHPDSGIHHENNGIGLLDSNFGLQGHITIQARHIAFPTAGIHEEEAAIRPFGLVGDPVAGYARDVLHHGYPLANNTIHQGGFANIRPPDNRHHGQRAGSGFRILRFFPSQECQIGLVQIVGFQTGAEHAFSVVRGGPFRAHIAVFLSHSCSFPEPCASVRTAATTSAILI